MRRTGKLLLTALLLVGFATAVDAQVGTNQGLLNPNVATAEELGSVPGLGADLEAAVLAGRPFLDIASLDALLAESLTPDQRSSVYRLLWIPIDIDRSSQESILLIPGVGARMTHEFEEYRPYRSSGALARFRREIGKYVADDEVARLEQYIFVPMNLNTASEDDFMTIPGVGRRMTHEFLEYRPYGSLDQFRREIGKYVDDAEVARLERYMTLD